MFTKTWVLVLVIHGVSTDLGPRMTAPECQMALKKYITDNPKQKYQAFCEWRNL